MKHKLHNEGTGLQAPASNTSIPHRLINNLWINEGMGTGLLRRQLSK